MMDERTLWWIDNDGLWAPFISADYLNRYNVLGMRNLLQELGKRSLYDVLHDDSGQKRVVRLMEFFLNGCQTPSRSA